MSLVEHIDKLKFQLNSYSSSSCWINFTPYFVSRTASTRLVSKSFRTSLRHHRRCRTIRRSSGHRDIRRSGIENGHRDFPKIDAPYHTSHFIRQRIQVSSTIGAFSNACSTGMREFKSSTTTVMYRLHSRNSGIMLLAVRQFASKPLLRKVCAPGHCPSVWSACRVCLSRCRYFH